MHHQNWLSVEHQCTVQKSGKRVDKLSKREAELNAKEEQLKKWEQELRSNGNLRPKKNWPRCWPILHHDIAGDVRVILPFIASTFVV